MSILQKADRCMDEAVALFGENKLFLAEKKAQAVSYTHLLFPMPAIPVMNKTD